MEITGTKRPLTAHVLKVDRLIVRGIPAGKRIYGTIVLISSESVPACLHGCLQLIAERNLCAREFCAFIGKEVAGSRMHLTLRRGKPDLTEFYLEVRIVALCISTLQCDRIAAICPGIVLHVGRRIKTCLHMPMAVDLSGRLETEQKCIIIHFAVCHIVAIAGIGVTKFAVPFHHIRVALEVGDTDTEVVKLICKLSGKTVNKRTIRCGHIALRHRLCDHLRHLVARDVAVTAERAVTIALDNAVCRELRHSVVCPMITRHVGEGVRRCERGRCRADRERCRESCCQSLLHGNSSLRDVPAIKE